MRDYGTATWEGGDPKCDHVADPTKTKVMGNPEFNKDRPSRRATKMKGYYKDICPKCGAKKVDKQIGLEKTPELYVQKMVEVFREIKRVLRDDGVVFLNLGDSYAGSGGAHAEHHENPGISKSFKRSGAPHYGNLGIPARYLAPKGLKPKDLIGIPWAVAFALRADGWYLRSDIIWYKKNPMPESVQDRPTRSHEYIFMLTKKARYFYDKDAITEPATESSIVRISQPTFDLQTGGDKDYGKTGVNLSRSMRRSVENFKQKNLGMGEDCNHQIQEFQGKNITQDPQSSARRMGLNVRLKREETGLHDGCFGVTRNARTVWDITTQARPDAHFATFPDEIPRRCILAGTSGYGCCPTCGAPWVRDVERGEIDRKTQPKRVEETGYVPGRTKKSRTNTVGMETLPKKMVGWKPTCTCGKKEVVPCVVLDPFVGSGTTPEVARELKRDCIGIDINREYVKIAKKRLRANEQLVPNVEVITIGVN